jgi:hypothetical protein
MIAGAPLAVLDPVLARVYAVETAAHVESLVSITTAVSDSAGKSSAVLMRTSTVSVDVTRPTIVIRIDVADAVVMQDD